MMRKLVFLLLVIGCNPVPMETDDEQKVLVEWGVSDVDTQTGTFLTYFKLINNTSKPLNSSNWKMYFNQVPGAEFKNEFVESIRVSGYYYQLTPTEQFKEVASGDSITISIQFPGPLNRISFVPTGCIFQLDGGIVYNADPLTNYFNNGFPTSFTQKEGFLSAEKLYEKYSSFSNHQSDNPTLVIPRPVSLKTNKGVLELSDIKVYFDPEFKEEANRLGERLSQLFSGTISLTQNPDEANVKLELNPNVTELEGYQISISDGIVHLQASTDNGAFYAVQSFCSLLPVNSSKPSTLVIPNVEISDYPRFSYRGLHLDLGRNFKSKKSVLEILDMMSMYKMNRLNLQLSDDEGWRIEIPALPELTQIGSRRGLTSDESDRLHPAYGSGENGDNGGSGYFSSSDFIEILKYANDRHIEVIPKIDVPGHARAAIISMNARYQRFMSEGRAQEAMKFMLRDLKDESKYQSVQYYTDNVVNVCGEGIYTFLETVVDEMIRLYQLAEAPLSIFHIGGDEVPNGAWELSPDCQAWLSNQPKSEHPKVQLMSYFVDRTNKLLSEKGLITAGWEEIAMEETPEGLIPNEQFRGRKFIPYVWHKENALPLTSAGFNIILANANSLYLDLAYDSYPNERGLVWAGTVGEEQPFQLDPIAPDKSPLISPKNVVGIQAQLWGETVRKDEDLGYYLFPKLISVAERAWSPAPEWSAMTGIKRQNSMHTDWVNFSAGIYSKEIQRIVNIYPEMNFRLPRPGVKIENGMVNVLVPYLGLEIRYTTDGSIPTINSQRYDSPFESSDSVLQFRTFYFQKQSDITFVRNEHN